MRIVAMVLGAVMGFAVAFVGIACLAGLLVWLLWNWLMPSIFGLPVITFWQGVGLSLLSSCLFRRGPAIGPKKE